MGSIIHLCNCPSCPFRDHGQFIYSIIPPGPALIVAHHGWPSTLISDNGTSFVGAQKELRKLVVEGHKQIEDFSVLHKVRWIFTTPLSPHQGGIYESLIKQTKRAIQVAIGQQTLSWNDMSTVFTEVECLLNSRPLRYCSNDPNDLRPLTSNHFMIGRTSAEVPQGPFEESRNLTKRLDYLQTLVSQISVLLDRPSQVDNERTSDAGERERNVLFNDAPNTFYLRLYGVRHMVKDHSDSEKENRCHHIGYTYRLTARVLLCVPSHRQDNTYHGLCYISRWTSDARMRHCSTR